MDHNMPGEKRNQVLARLKEKGVEMASVGVMYGKGEEGWRKVFDFAKAMNIKTIAADPELADIPVLSKLCDEYNINIAIHNHPEPSRYWNPDIILNAVKGTIAHALVLAATSAIGYVPA
jgi:sugar phosphate isomerase/epimerase